MVTTSNSAIIPFYYQSECLEVLDRVDKIQNAALVVMAGGLGKTILSALYAKKRFVSYYEKRCLYLCHQNDILEQAEIDYRRVFGSSLTYGFFNGDIKENLQANVVFASFQTMRENLHLFSGADFDFIVVDETHHAKAATYERVIYYFSPKFLLGITALPDRLDRLDIRDIYGKEVYHLSVVKALARGLLCPIDYRIMSDEIGSLRKIETEHGRLSTRLLNQTIFIPKRDVKIAKIIQQHILQLRSPKAIIFSPSIEHAELLAEMVPNSIPVHSKVTKSERKVRLELFRQGIFGAIICVDMFNEGLDVPDANLIVFLRSTSSPSLYYQQLMRGLRLSPGKEKVTVLDFVANCERILMVYELWTKVKTERELIASSKNKFLTEDDVLTVTDGISTSSSLTGKRLKDNANNNSEALEPFSLNIEAVDFKQRIFPLIEAIQKIREGFYASWEEASQAAKKLGITSHAEYVSNYKKDPKLVYAPSKYYEDFPGWPIFTGNFENTRLVKYCYSTWQEASEAAVKLGIQTPEDYLSKYLQDPKLPRMPTNAYSDFPGWPIFTGNLENVRQVEYCYSTWQEASEAAVKLGIKTWDEYKIKYKADAKLPSNPNNIYKDFPGHLAFLKKPEPGQKWYKTWQEASDAACKLGITSFEEYQLGYKKDPMLPSTPYNVYENFPGMLIFLKLIYETWQEASDAAIKLGIKNRREYERRYKEDGRLISKVRNYKGFPGWSVFLGKK